MDISAKIRNQFPEFIEGEYPEFVKFVKHYYEFLESAELSFADSATAFAGINFQINDTVSVKNSTGTLIHGSVAVIRGIDKDNNRLFISSNNKFSVGSTVFHKNKNDKSEFFNTETKIGAIESYSPNPVQTVDQLLEYRDIDSTISKFFNSFREEFMATIPHFDQDLDKYSIIKNITDLYREKGTVEGHRLFFKLLLNQEPDEIYFPGDDVLEVSDGEWSRVVKMRISAPEISPGMYIDPVNLIGSKISQSLGTISAIIESANTLAQIEFPDNSIIELNLNSETIVGEFSLDENCLISNGTETEDISVILAPMITEIIVDNPSQYYNIDDVIEIVVGSGISHVPPTITVENITSGYITHLEDLDGTDTGFSKNDPLIFSNVGEMIDGEMIEVKSAEALISGVNHSLVFEDDSDIIQEDFTVYISGEPGRKFSVEDGSFSVDNGTIGEISIIDSGQGYKKLPVVTANGTHIFAESKDIGGIRGAKIIDPGFFTSTVDVDTKALATIIIKDNISIAVDDVVSQIQDSLTISGTVVSWDSALRMIKVKMSEANEYFDKNSTITIGIHSTVIVAVETAKCSVKFSPLFESTGIAITEDGFISQKAKRIYDGLYYQSFSYLVKISDSIQTWRTAIKNTVHPAGFAVFGEINIKNRLEVKIKPVTGVNWLRPTYTPELFSMFRTIFDSVAKNAPSKIESNYTINWMKPYSYVDRSTYGGSRLINLDKWKFAAPPHPAGESHGLPGIYRQEIIEPSWVKIKFNATIVSGFLTMEWSDLLLMHVTSYMHHYKEIRSSNAGSGIDFLATVPNGSIWQPGDIDRDGDAVDVSDSLEALRHHIGLEDATEAFNYLRDQYKSQFGLINPVVGDDIWMVYKSFYDDIENSSAFESRVGFSWVSIPCKVTDIIDNGDHTADIEISIPIGNHSDIHDRLSDASVIGFPAVDQGFNHTTLLGGSLVGDSNSLNNGSIRLYITEPDLTDDLNISLPVATLTSTSNVSTLNPAYQSNLATFDIIATSNQTEFIFDTDFTIDNIDVILNNDSFTLLEDGFDLILETGYGIQQESWYTMGSTEYTHEFITTNNLPQIKVTLNDGVDVGVKVSLVINSSISVPTGYSISQFKDYKISDVTNYPGMRTNIPPPSEITFRPFPL